MKAEEERQFHRDCDSAEGGDGWVRYGRGDTDGGVFGTEEEVQEVLMV